MKLWEKGVSLSGDIEKFTVGRDRELDLLLAPYDVLGTLAHIGMLREIGILHENEWEQLRKELLLIYEDIDKGDFQIEESVEDVHSQIEFLLTEKLGAVGKKIHSGRSRNDQVLVDIKMFLRDEIKKITELTTSLSQILLDLSDQHQKCLIPGYTHMQAAMPSSFGLWFGAYAESFIDDLRLLKAAFEVVNQNPLGSAAGYGNSFPLDRQLTTRLLGFAELHVNVVAAQMSRGKTEAAVSFAVSALASTLGRMCMDICLYNSQDFGFLSFPDQITTGSSIMPHKKNPDVFELIRGRCNHLQTLPGQLLSIGTNLPSGYHRDMQITKEILLPAVQHLKDCLKLAAATIQMVQVDQQAIGNPKYDLIYSVENVNAEVLGGASFRDAYHKIAKSIAQGTFTPIKKIGHTHLGSIGNLGTPLIKEKLNRVSNSFEFEHFEKSLKKLIEN